MVLHGGVMAMRESLKLLADQALRDSPPWPPLESFACAACHHDLRSGGDLPPAAAAGRPGRPPLHYWSDVLVTLGLVQASTSSEQMRQRLSGWQDLRGRLQTALRAKPFGDPAALATDGGDGAAQQVIAWLDELLVDMQAAPLRRDHARRALKILIGLHPPSGFDPRTDVADYHSARQLGWALRMLHRDLGQPAEPGGAAAGDAAAGEGGAGPPASAVAQPSPFAQTLAALAQQLHLDLPAGAGGDITARMPVALQAPYAFQADAFQEHLAELRRQWPDECRRLEAPRGAQ